MNAAELTKLTIKELKAIAQEKGIEVSGDKRSKATWVLAIELCQSVEATDAQMEQIAHAADERALTQTPEPSAEIIEPSPTPEKVLSSKSTIESSGIDSPIPEPEPNPQVSEQTVPQQRGACTVMLVIIVALLFTLVLAGKVLRAFLTLSAWVWRSISRSISKLTLVPDLLIPMPVG